MQQSLVKISYLYEKSQKYMYNETTYIQETYFVILSPNVISIAKRFRYSTITGSESVFLNRLLRFQILHRFIFVPQ
jgi:hypothetical protein